MARALPKSTGRDLFNLDWLQQHVRQFSRISAVDVQATLCAFSAQSIADMLLRCSTQLTTLYVCGGGANNRHLCQLLAQALPGIAVDNTTSLGVAPDQVEGLAFAWLAYRHVHAENGNLPHVTGAQGGRILGACYPA